MLEHEAAQVVAEHEHDDDTVKAPKADVAVDPSKDASKDKNAEVMVSKSSNMGKKKNSNLATIEMIAMTRLVLTVSP